LEKEEEEVMEEDDIVSTTAPIIDGGDEVEDHQDVFPSLIYTGRSKRVREADVADEAGGQSQRPRPRPRYIPGM